jgi:hypothetical protein
MKNTIFVPMNGETGGTMGPNGKLQLRRIKALLVKELPEAIVYFHPNHYCCSAFIVFSPDNIMYFSCSDFRFFPQQFYIRTAKHTKDYGGGVNHHYTDYNDIISAIKSLKEVNFTSKK